MDGGADLNLGGVLGYYQDLLYICILVQLGSLLTRTFWLVFLTVSPTRLHAPLPCLHPGPYLGCRSRNNNVMHPRNFLGAFSAVPGRP